MLFIYAAGIATVLLVQKFGPKLKAEAKAEAQKLEGEAKDAVLGEVQTIKNVVASSIVDLKAHVTAEAASIKAHALDIHFGKAVPPTDGSK